MLCFPPLDLPRIVLNILPVLVHGQRFGTACEIFKPNRHEIPNINPTFTLFREPRQLLWIRPKNCRDWGVCVVPSDHRVSRSRVPPERCRPQLDGGRTERMCAVNPDQQNILHRASDPLGLQDCEDAIEALSKMPNLLSSFNGCRVTPDLAIGNLASHWKTFIVALSSDTVLSIGDRSSVHSRAAFGVRK